MTKTSKITAAILAAIAAGLAWWYMQLTPKAGAVCATPGQVAKAPDGSLLTCQDGVQWKPAN